jgi:hypothetical protein
MHMVSLSPYLLVFGTCLLLSAIFFENIRMIYTFLFLGTVISLFGLIVVFCC